MVNFKKMHDDWWNTLPKERQDEILRIRTLEKEHLYYETTTLLDDEFGKEKKERLQEVRLYRSVSGDGELSKTIVLSFGGYREYSFDKRFCLKIFQGFKNNSEKRFFIDAGNALYVKNKEILRIMKEAVQAMNARGMELTEDYFPDLRKTDMGKMLNEMGLL